MQIIPLNIFKHLYSIQEATILIQFEFSLCIHPWTGHHGQGDRHFHRLQRCPRTPMNWSPRSRWQARPSPPKVPSYTHELVTAVKVTGTSIASKGALGDFNLNLRLPSWLSSKESTCQFGRHGFDPWSRKTPHAVEQLSLCATTAEPVL